MAAWPLFHIHVIAAFALPCTADAVVEPSGTSLRRVTGVTVLNFWIPRLSDCSTTSYIYHLSQLFLRRLSYIPMHSANNLTKKSLPLRSQKAMLRSGMVSGSV
ncbi:hypothetical protein FAP94_18250 [Morganella morganii]|nr:hypothetical protein [Morganella morganii]